MMTFGALNWFDSFIKKLKKSIELYYPCDLHLCVAITDITETLPLAHNIIYQLVGDKENRGGGSF